MQRHDYAYPFEIDPLSRQATSVSYEDHIEQMIRQLLLTAPGERINRPSFGCGLRQLIFTPYSEALTATAHILILQSLNEWLGTEIEVQRVDVNPPSRDPNDSSIVILIQYFVKRTRANKRMNVKIQ